MPKTLIFAKSDSHADDIVQIVREEFGKGNEFCRKITYKVDGNPNDEISAFRNDFSFRVAVTVDMIATGTDIKPLEILLFMRDVRSKNYYEQMKGRGTRVVDYDDLIKVSPSAKTNKDHFVIFDAVGVTKSPKVEGRTLERNPSESTKQIMLQIALGSQDEDLITTMAGRLTRLDRIMSDEERESFKEICGLEPKDVVMNMLDCFDDDYVRNVAEEKLGPNFNIDQFNETKKELIKQSTKVFSNPKLRDHVLKIRKTHDQVVDTYNLDTVTFSGWSDSYSDEALNVIKSFREFIEANKDEIDALSIIYNQQYKNRHLTEKMIKELYEIIANPPHNFTLQRLRNNYSISVAK